MDRAVFTIYLIILILSPLLFGSVHTYAYTIMVIGVLTGAFLLLIKNIRKDPGSGAYRFQFPRTSLNFVLLILLSFLIFQIIPLPDFLLKFLSPEASVVAHKSLPAPDVIVHSNQDNAWFSLSPYYYPVRMSLVRFIAYGLFFTGFAQILNSKKRIEFVILVILIISCFEAIYGLAQAYSESGHILWLQKGVYQKDICGTYINRNHFAGLMEISLLLAASYSAALLNKKKKIASAHKKSMRAWLSQYLSMEQRFNKRTFVLFIGAMAGVGLIFSASRGGMIAGAGGMLCMSLLFIFRKNYRRKGLIVFLLFCTTAAYSLDIGVDYPLGRFKYFDESFNNRFRYTQKTIDMFQDYKLTGIGTGNFQYAYPKYQSDKDKKRYMRFAHNDWAQFVAEAGITGICLMLSGIFYYLYQTLKMWKKRRYSFAVCLGIAPLPIMTAVAIHSYSDFNLHIPSNFLILVATMSIGYAALHLTAPHSKKKTFCKYHIIPLKYKGFFVLFLILGLIGWSGFWTIRHFVAEAYCNTVPNSTLNRDKTPPPEEIKNAISWDRWNAGYWYKLAMELMRIREIEYKIHDTVESMVNNHMEIISALEKAVALNPFNSQYHVRLGWEYTYLWQTRDYHKKWLPAADISMERAAYFAGEKNPNLHVEIGNYWVMRSKTIDTGNLERDLAWNKACWHYKKAQSLEKKKSLTKKIAKYINNFYSNKEIIQEALLIEIP